MLLSINTGGILLGLHADMFECIECITKTYCLTASIKNKDGTVYGTSYAEFKLDFIAELHGAMDILTYLVLFEGDFNFVREARDKSSVNINASWTFLFNDWIN